VLTPKEACARKSQTRAPRRGGAGFSCGLKWSLVDRKSGKPIYLIANADESERDFKDKQILYKDPINSSRG